MFQMDELEHFLYARIDLGFRLAGDFEPEGDVFIDVHVGEKRVGLEHHADIALIGAERRLVLPVDDDRSAGRNFKTGDHAQHGGLAAARWSKKGDELALFDGHVEIMHDLHGAEGFLDIAKCQKAHENLVLRPWEARPSGSVKRVGSDPGNPR
ncbi:hypothetical protein D3C72_1330050 [compost metagenome]